MSFSAAQVPRTSAISLSCRRGRHWPVAQRSSYQHFLLSKLSCVNFLLLIIAVITRNRDALVPTFQRLSFAQLAVSFAVQNVWNGRPGNIKHCTSVDGLKKKLKKNLTVSRFFQTAIPFVFLSALMETTFSDHVIVQSFLVLSLILLNIFGTLSLRFVGQKKLYLDTFSDQFLQSPSLNMDKLIDKCILIQYLAQHSRYALYFLVKFYYQQYVQVYSDVCCLKSYYFVIQRFEVSLIMVILILIMRHTSNYNNQCFLSLKLI